MKFRRLLLLSVALLPACSWVNPPVNEPQVLTMIVINDTYRLDNLPYVRTLREALEKEYGHVVVLHAGDFLFPSMLSQEFNGEQMIDMFNRLDGDVQKQDLYFFATFGNHEFDKAEMKHAPMLNARIAESQFDWLGSNIVFRNGANGVPVVTGKNLVNSRLVDVNGITVGLVGSTIDSKYPAYVERFAAPADTLKRESAELRAQGADVVVALTHLRLSQDMDLLDRLGDGGPDFIAGGHEHDRKNEIVHGRHVVKADADAVSAAVVRITPGPAPMKTAVEFVDLPGKFTPDAGMQARIDYWNGRFANVFCTRNQAPPDCMKQVYGQAKVDLMAEELTIRRFETNLGNFLADTARDAYAAKGAKIAFLNSGGMRLNYNIPAGPITRTQIDSLFAYETKISLIRLTGRQLQQVVNHAITDWTGNGRWLQISGFVFRHDPEKETAEGLSLITPQGLQAIKPDDVLLAVTNNFLISDSSDKDGYSMLSEAMRVDPALAQPDLKKLVTERIVSAGESGIAPVKQGRVCNVRLDAACQFVP